MAAMAAVAAVEKMHQWASQQQQERQHTEQMRAMLGEQKKTRDGEEGEQYQSRLGTQPIACFGRMFMFHRRSPLIFFSDLKMLAGKILQKNP
jgi:hypothetical protein